jgi:hypothetical protein
MKFSASFSLTIAIVLVALVASSVKASPTPDEYHKEIGCFAYPAATTRTPFCTPQ